MSSNPLPETSAADQEFARHWAESTAQVLEQVRGAPFTATPLSPAEPDDTAFERVWVQNRREASGRICISDRAARCGDADAAVDVRNARRRHAV
jgi:hypothetical protein